MKAKITGTRAPGVLFLAKNRLLIPKDEAAIFLPLPIPIEALNVAQSCAQKPNELEDLLAHLQIPDHSSVQATLRLQSAVDGRNECSTDFLSDSVTVVLENVYMEVLPRWIPFLMIPVSTSREHQD